MTTNDVIKRLQDRITFLRAKFATSKVSSFDRSEEGALQHAIIRLKQYTEILPDILELAKTDPKIAEIIQKLRDVEEKSGRRVKGAIWKGQTDTEETTDAKAEKKANVIVQKLRDKKKG